jgi:hypothetical protein
MQSECNFQEIKIDDQNTLSFEDKNKDTNSVTVGDTYSDMKPRNR